MTNDRNCTIRRRLERITETGATAIRPNHRLCLLRNVGVGSIEQTLPLILSMGDSRIKILPTE